MYRVRCLECGKMIELDSYCEIGDGISCEHCYSDFEITSIDPVKIKNIDEDGISSENDNEYDNRESEDEDTY